ncbi:hemocyte protein-glutamine gamma-glutamyltransferase-like [Mercenaria mercenaria]|uniref:hemocyte protein-glutamine gamma-glutamyltransferase-like n=1 Tax=Mercenaria mercenaria TaxID=6596 RepID=UPI00234F02E5|nr:hemocyte protein-glutamine gamma-glutamyltransferase-like [Mercenaria mercenaria]
MYGSYRSSYYPSYRYSYPSYGYGSSYYDRIYGNYSYGNYDSGGSDYGSSNYGSYDPYPYYSNYYYGYGRRRRNYWERDRDTYNSWRRNENTARTRTPSPETPPPPPQPEVPEEELVKELHVKDIDLHIKANTEKHRTADYDCTKDRKVDGKLEPAELVVRRGDTIKMTITFDKSPYSKEKNDLQLIFSIGKDPKPARGTKVEFKIDESGNQKFKPDKWGATLQDKTGNDITILVYIPANCIIGEWNFYVKTISEGKDKDGKDKTLSGTYKPKDDITILFNPWCKEDGVYMATENLLNEYICNENGAVWRGNHEQRGASAWNYGQFEEGILEICLHLVRSGFGPDKLRHMSNPVQVSRMIVKMVNASDDNGVIMGNWSGEYEGGTPPWKWAGSIKILKQWQKSGPVKFGQCWVFACVTTTVCRALGIPCRTVTNFASAHDTDETNSIEKYFSPDDEELEEYNADSIWNFHVWNEAWMARPDLEPYYPYGWQVIDATPQERSEGVYMCGPCPVAAIRKGDCSTKYDAGFIFSEVNADKVHWRVFPGDRAELIEILKDKIGKFISTKTPTGLQFKYKKHMSMAEKDDYAMERCLDLTMDYKPKEGTEAERESVMNAHRTARFPIIETYLGEEEIVKHVEFHLYHDNKAMIGSKMEIEFTAKNTGRNERKISYASIRVYAQSYTGYNGRMLLSRTFNGATLKPGEEKRFGAVLEPDDYLYYLLEQASVRIDAKANVDRAGDEEKQRARKEHVVRFRRPDLEVEGPEETKVGDTVRFKVTVINPLDRPLTNCSFSMESVGFEDLSEDVPTMDVPARGVHTEEFMLRAVKRKKYGAVYFSFDCKEIPDISGSTEIRINP